MTKKLTPQQEANKKQDEKRQTAPRLPGTRLTTEQGKVMDELYALFDNKSEAIFEAANFYLENVDEQ
jgi:hypothetical protein